MKTSLGKTVLASATAWLLAATLPGALARAQDGVAMTLGEPAFYGRIDLADAPQPRLIYSQPVIVERRSERSEPIYLRVPPGHARHWRDHCREYDACGESVYFVRDDWYSGVYVPHYRDRHGGGERRHLDKNPHRDGDSRGDTELRFS